MKKKIVALSLFFVTICAVWLGAATPQWIQYYERVVGENSPYYDDVVNRPSKQIWANFTSEHTDSGTHKAFLSFPTPIPTVPFPTPIPTLPYPTPAPTATPVEIPTPIPTCTPITLPTPLPTATPITIPTPLPTPTPLNTSVYDEHLTNFVMYHHNNSAIEVTTSQTLSSSDLNGQTIYVTVANRTLTLPSSANLSQGGRQVTVIALHDSGTLTIAAGANTTIVNPTVNMAHTQIVSPSAPLGASVTLRYLNALAKWVIVFRVGTWTSS